MNIAEVFGSLGDMTRLRIVNLLIRSGELCVCDIYGILKLSQPKVSRHLALLKFRGLVMDRSVGLWSLYKLKDEVFTPSFRELLRTMFESDPVFRKDLDEFENQVGQKCCATFVSIPGIRIPESIQNQTSSNH